MVPTRKKTIQAVRRATGTHRKYHAKIAVGKLLVDPDLQRMYDPKLADRLETGWDERYMGTLIVSKRANGTYFIVDGQHRAVVALRKHGAGYLVDCEVHEGLTRVEEGQMFLHHNRDRKAVRPFDNYRVSLMSAEPREIRVDAEVSSCGLGVAPTASTNLVGAVTTLCRLADEDTRGGLIHDVLRIAESAWGRAADSWDGMMIHAIGTLILKNRSTIDHKRLATVLRRAPVAEWKRASIASTVGGGGSVSRSNKLREVIALQFNNRYKNQTTVKQLVW